jgi:hypothetical protein
MSVKVSTPTKYLEWKAHNFVLQKCRWKTQADRSEIQRKDMEK